LKPWIPANISKPQFSFCGSPPPFSEKAKQQTTEQATGTNESQLKQQPPRINHAALSG
jgi:hypothetical protein